MKIKSLVAAISIVCSAGLMTSIHAQTLDLNTPAASGISDDALIKDLPGFQSKFATVDGIRLHYVIGGQGDPVVLLPGWPETWWAYHKIMPELAQNHRVIAVDVRGMGTSDKPLDGYDKKSMAGDIAELIYQLGYERADVVGHDIGAMVAFSLAANHSDEVKKLVLLDVAHPSAGYKKIPMLPDPGTFDDKIDEDHPYLWWFAFHQVKGLPEELLEGRAGLEQQWFFRYMLKDENAIDPRDKAIYAAAYSSRDAIRSSNAWYQAFNQDIADDDQYAPLSMPVLGLGGPGYRRLKATLDQKVPDSHTYRISGSGHFIAEEKPAELMSYLNSFLR